MKNNTLLYVITRSDVLGGASIHLIDLIRHANKQGYQVHVAMGGKGEFSCYLEQHEQCQVHCLTHLKRELSLVSDFKAIEEIRVLIKSLSPGLVHLHSAKAGLVGRLAVLGLGVPCVFTVHGWPFTDGIPTIRKNVYLSIEWIMSWLPNYIITVSERDRFLAQKYHFANMNKMVAIQNGVAPATNSGKAKYNTDDAVIRFAMVARFDVPKCQHVVLDALSRCQDSNLSIDFIGDGPALESCKQQAVSLGVDNRVRFHGFLAAEQVRNVLAQCHGFLLISDWEGLPLTVIEAMSEGLPVIVSDVGGVSELVSHEQTGFLIPRDNRVEKLAKVFERYAQQPGLLEQHGEKGLDAYNKQFTLELMLTKTFDLYQKASQ
jgi:glycosyltransferase involved in cell wall biosynthesis